MQMLYNVTIFLVRLYFNAKKSEVTNVPKRVKAQKIEPTRSHKFSLKRGYKYLTFASVHLKVRRPELTTSSFAVNSPACKEKVLRTSKLSC
jgi:hypothetical protein